MRTTFSGSGPPIHSGWRRGRPPTRSTTSVARSRRAGAGGLEDAGGGRAAAVNVNGPRYGAVWSGDRRLLGLNNIELITDRPLELNLREIKAVKRDYPDRAVLVSLMVPCEELAWRRILRQVEETGADGVELNFGCPHGMQERGMGAAVGQVPEYIEMVTRWVKAATRMPVIVKLTPNVADIRYAAPASRAGGADAVSLINTVNSITSVNLDTFSPEPTIDGEGSHGGFAGPAIKPIGLQMAAEIARDPETAGLPLSGIRGIGTWRDAAEYIALGCGNVQVCTVAMVYGFRIVEEMIAGLQLWMEDKGYERLPDFQGRAVRNVTDWQHLNLNYTAKARIDQDVCIKCGRRYAACEDTSHQSIAIRDGRVYEVIDEECVACNLCVITWPVEDCITMESLPVGAVDPRTGQAVEGYANWTTNPNNPEVGAEPSVS